MEKPSNVSIIEGIDLARFLDSAELAVSELSSNVSFNSMHFRRKDIWENGFLNSLLYSHNMNFFPFFSPVPVGVLGTVTTFFHQGTIK